MRQMKCALIVAALLLPALSAQAVPANVAAAVAAKDRAEADIKLDEGRKPVEVLQFLGLEKGDRALDLLAGGGYYSEIMARAVGPKGAVVAWNPPGIAANEQAKTAWAGIRSRVKNASAFAMPLPNLALAPSSFDFALLHLVYHDAYWESAEYKFDRAEPAEVLAKLYATMKPGGTVGVIDHVGPAGVDTRALVDKVHRIDPAVIRADFERAGFAFEGESDVLRVPGDDLSKSVFDPAVRGKTDRVVYKFTKPATPKESQPAMACDAGKADSLIGQLVDNTFVEKAKALTGARTVRVVPPGTAVTMDYREDRLTIATDEANKATRINCG